MSRPNRASAYLVAVTTLLVGLGGCTRLGTLGPPFGVDYPAVHADHDTASEERHALYGEHPDLMKTAEACTARLEQVATAHGGAHGPQVIAKGEVRVHEIVSEGGREVVREHRCLGEEYNTRSWLSAGGDHSAEPAPH